ncbi:MAG: hypothetical protein FJ104_15360, partial [Deltaproteobacteria bacterium]|nr:hypothetical protein [Deltaproteobacteria bacterium]
APDGAPPLDPEEDEREPALGDPLLAALGGDADIAVVLEVAAFRELPLGKLLFDCLAQKAGDELEKARRELGFDLRDVERVALHRGRGAEPVAMLSGRIPAERLEAAFGERARRVPHGERGVLLSAAGDGGAGRHLALWGDELLLAASREEDLRAALDRVEGRAPADSVALPSELAYGELYGRIPAEVLSELLPDDLSRAVRAAARDVELHVDARDDALLVADVRGGDVTGMDELGRTFGGALSAARLAARARGEDRLVELLDLARVAPGNDATFRVEAALPLHVVEEALGDCARGAPR